MLLNGKSKKLEIGTERLEELKWKDESDCSDWLSKLEGSNVDRTGFQL